METPVEMEEHVHIACCAPNAHARGSSTKPLPVGCATLIYCASHLGAAAGTHGDASGDGGGPTPQLPSGPCAGLLVLQARLLALATEMRLACELVLSGQAVASVCYSSLMSEWRAFLLLLRSEIGMPSSGLCDQR